MNKNKRRKCSHKGCENTVKVGKDYYCTECREEYNHKRYQERSHLGYYLYVVLNKDEKVEYVGATEAIKSRIEYSHISGNSNIKELMMSEDWEYIKYLDITDIVENRNELLVLENTLIDLYPNKWNTHKKTTKELDKLREFSLLSELHSLDKKWKLYCTREEIREKKITKRQKKMLL